MRPWLLIPFVLPALWIGITYAGLWPDEVVGWIASPIFAMIITLGGVAIALLADTVVRANPMRRSQYWFVRPQEDKPFEESTPLVSSGTPIAQAWRSTKAQFDLQVGMPERQTATPAPRA